MLQVLYTATTGLEAQELKTDVIANNVANINTTGFKRKRPEFQDLLYDIKKMPGTSVEGMIPTGLQIGLGVAAIATYSIHEQGSLTPTENDLDVAIQGKGFFQITRQDGSIFYTRAGAFTRDSNGEIVTLNGDLVSPTITIPITSNNLTIDPTGKVYVTNIGQTAPTLLGQFDMVGFINPAGLESVGNNLYKETDSSGPPLVGLARDENGFGEIRQRWLEASNVEPIKELTDLISAQRGYEMCSKLLTAGSEMYATAIHAVAA